MSAIRAFFAKVPRPSVRQAAVGATAVSAVALGGFLYQQNPAGVDTAYEKILEKTGMKKKEEQRAAVVEEVVKKEEDPKPQQAPEETAGK